MELSQLIRRLEDECLKVLDFFNQLEEDAWEEEIYTDGEIWKVHQILAHFVSVERAFQWLTEDIVSGGGGTPEDFDLDRFNNAQVRQLQPLPREELITAFQAERAKTIDQASRYDAHDLKQEGHHPWFGQTSVEKLLKLLYRHNQLHLRDIRRHLSSRTP